MWGRSEVAAAIEELYEAFPGGGVSGLYGCPHCVDRHDIEPLLGDRRSLDGDALSFYAFKAMTTFGDGDHFKHFLPRLFELVIDGTAVTDVRSIAGKLDYGEWGTWPERQRTAVLGGVRATFHACVLDDRRHLDLGDLTSLTDLPTLLSWWPVTDSRRGHELMVDAYLGGQAASGLDDRETFEAHFATHDVVAELERAFYAHLDALEVVDGYDHDAALLVDGIGFTHAAFVERLRTSD